jgi:hypothetical protein
VFHGIVCETKSGGFLIVADLSGIEGFYGETVGKIIGRKQDFGQEAVSPMLHLALLKRDGQILADTRTNVCIVLVECFIARYTVWNLVVDGR